MKQRRYIMLFGDTHAAVSELDDEAAGRLLKAILRYAEDHEEVALPGEEKLVYRMLLSQFARDEEAYRRRSEQNRRQHVSRVQQASAPVSTQYKDKDQDEEKEKEKDEDKDEEGVGGAGPRKDKAPAARRSFTPPSPGEVRAYCQENGLTFDVARFMDYNAARGWRMGGALMDDWKAAARVWAARGDFPSGSGPAPPARGPRILAEQNYTQREYTNNLDALDQMMARFNAGAT